jgi:hypothetical protein
LENPYNLKTNFILKKGRAGLSNNFVPSTLLTKAKYCKEIHILGRILNLCSIIDWG